MSSVYDDYMRSVFGYEPINYRNTYEQDYNDYMEYANYSIPQQTNRNNETLEECYPDIYKLVYPMVQKACTQNTRNLSNELIDDMTDEIYFAIEDDNLNRSLEQSNLVDTANNTSAKRQIDNKLVQNQQENRDINNRQRIRNQSLRDLIKILILRELINRPGFRPRPPMPPPPRPTRHPMPPSRPPMRPGMGRPPFNRDLYEQDY